MERDGRGGKLLAALIFYAVVLALLLLLWAIFFPAASVLRQIGQRSGQGPAILIPVSFLLLSFLYAFVRARRHMKRSQIVAAYGWLLGASLLSISLLYLYLKQMSGS